MKKFGQILQNLRNKKGVTQEDLGKTLNLSQSAIAFYESGRKQPSLETLKAIANFFNVSIDYLLDNEGNSNLTEFSLSPQDQETLGKIKKLSDEDRELVETIIKMRQKEESATKNG